MPYFTIVSTLLNIVLIFIGRIKFSGKNTYTIELKIKPKLNLN